MATGADILRTDIESARNKTKIIQQHILEGFADFLSRLTAGDNSLELANGTHFSDILIDATNQDDSPVLIYCIVEIPYRILGSSSSSSSSSGASGLTYNLDYDAVTVLGSGKLPTTGQSQEMACLLFLPTPVRKALKGENDPSGFFKKFIEFKDHIIFHDLVPYGLPPPPDTTVNRTDYATTYTRVLEKEENVYTLERFKVEKTDGDKSDGEFRFGYKRIPIEDVFKFSYHMYDVLYNTKTPFKLNYLQGANKATYLFYKYISVVLVVLGKLNRKTLDKLEYLYYRNYQNEFIGDAATNFDVFQLTLHSDVLRDWFEGKGYMKGFEFRREYWELGYFNIPWDVLGVPIYVSLIEKTFYIYGNRHAILFFFSIFIVNGYDNLSDYSKVPTELHKTPSIRTFNDIIKEQMDRSA